MSRRGAVSRARALPVVSSVAAAGARKLCRSKTCAQCGLSEESRATRPWWLITFTDPTRARGLYESRDFSAMPILADARQEVPSAKREGFAGCNDEAILTHCRGPGPHTRGCWCVDACLGKS
jgi:hypothetical protein